MHGLGRNVNPYIPYVNMQNTAFFCMMYVGPKAFVHMTPGPPIYAIL